MKELHKGLVFIAFLFLFLSIPDKHLRLSWERYSITEPALSSADLFEKEEFFTQSAESRTKAQSPSN